MIKPSEYQSAAREVLHQFRSGRVVSVDLRSMNYHSAARLVDFLSGMTASRSGWIFRITDDVIVLNPATSARH
ncbi:cell division protein SepF [Saccharopolyspora shandongensis]|uniref:cell division protein SepF n=1 Tax=Saccharopolyspora shandongensis TaxID=418495 RepID=UPI00342B61C4